MFNVSCTALQGLSALILFNTSIENSKDRRFLNTQNKNIEVGIPAGAAPDQQTVPASGLIPGSASERGLLIQLINQRVTERENIEQSKVLCQRIRASENVETKQTEEVKHSNNLVRGVPRF